jgi:hypothetical protein
MRRGASRKPDWTLHADKHPTRSAVVGGEALVWHVHPKNRKQFHADKKFKQAQQDLEEKYGPRLAYKKNKSQNTGLPALVTYPTSAWKDW